MNFLREISSNRTINLKENVLGDDKTCALCYSEHADNFLFCFKNCGHSMYLCQKLGCAIKLGNKCPFCRAPGQKIRVNHQSL